MFRHLVAFVAVGVVVEVPVVGLELAAELASVAAEPVALAVVGL
jgi:hypothetical protein